MIGMRIVQSLSFYEPARVIEPAARAQPGVHARAGAYVRRDARQMIRPGRRTSRPGRPPVGHNNRLRDNIHFAVDEKGAAIIGPEKLNTVFFDGSGQPLSGTVPEVLESPEGGDIQVLEVFNESSQKWHHARRNKGSLAGRKTRLRKVHIASRPFMVPALQKNLNKFPGLWANVITD